MIRARSSDLLVSSLLLNVTPHPESFLADYTTQEYFSNQRESLFPDAQVDIALTCLRYLSYDALGQGRDASWSPSHHYPFVLYAAIHWGHHAHSNEEATLDMVQEFLSRKQNVACTTTMLRSQDYNLGRPGFGEIHLRSFFGLGRAMSQLLQVNHGADSKDSKGRTPLSYAAQYGHSEVTKFLLARDDVDVSSKDKDDQSPLSYADLYGIVMLQHKGQSTTGRTIWSCWKLISPQIILILFAASVECACSVFSSHRINLHGTVMLQHKESGCSC